VAYVWDWWCRLHQARGHGAAGPQPIGYTEIDAWARLTQRRLDLLEIDCLVTIDRLFLNSLVKSNNGD
jgi:hypothetical protein